MVFIFSFSIGSVVANSGKLLLPQVIRFYGFSVLVVTQSILYRQIINQIIILSNSVMFYAFYCDLLTQYRFHPLSTASAGRSLYINLINCFSPLVLCILVSTAQSKHCIQRTNSQVTVSFRFENEIPSLVCRRYTIALYIQGCSGLNAICVILYRLMTWKPTAVFMSNILSIHVYRIFEIDHNNNIKHILSSAVCLSSLVLQVH